ncbi:aminoglycoside 6-adenylyltransferase [Alkalicoccus daliensis]|uniref:Aminoglycoside 6-adenylyltransferase n=1 Tax=Alkalicoccus daliensis TaxID=745820 RepID=A0A1H0HTJ5_9BACI|nr:aminoglycoside 6-adenylyltransferase [Alkalicoccus daliensis]SDO22506.1 aminoglycoside 6-adenylyltransferase [Alkalicoccus daliensis]
MRTEKEMMAIILGAAEQEEKIRTAVLNGSRVNNLAKKDHWQDYDIAYIVTDIEDLLLRENWLEQFGEILIMQRADDFSLSSTAKKKSYTFLMQFTDGNRIDLTLVPLEEKESFLKRDSLTKILLEKDQAHPLPPPDDSFYWIEQPSISKYRDCCNEFWWVSLYVIKGLERGELLYSMEHLNIMREMLLQMLDWNIGSKYDFKVSTGKNHKFIQQFLTQSQWKSLLQTYPQALPDAQLKAFWKMVHLFEEAADEAAAQFQYPYNSAEAENIKDFIRKSFL